MELYVIIPKLRGINEEEIEKSKKAVLNQWSLDCDIRYIVEEGESYTDIYNKVLDKLTQGLVLFLPTNVFLKDRVFEKARISDLLSGSEDTLVFGYEKMSFNEPSYVELSDRRLSLRDYLTVLHEHPGDITYTSLFNKILSIDIINKHGIRFNPDFRENFECAFFLEYLEHSSGVVFSKQTIATFFTQPQPELLVKERINEKKRLFVLFEKLLSKEFDKDAAIEVMDKERLDYVVYELLRMGESPSAERNYTKKLLRGILSEVKNMTPGTKALLRLRLLKGRVGRIKNYWLHERKNNLREEKVSKEKKKEIFRQNNYHRVRAPFRAFHNRFSKEKYILLYCESQTMKPHIFDYYNCVKDLSGVRFFIYYPGGWDDEIPEKVTLIKSHFKALNTPWDMIILADAKVPLYYSRKETKLIYINHGLHMISYDGGETLYAYDSGRKLFSAMLEPNRNYAAILSKEHEDECIKHVGYKNAEAIIEQINNRTICRKNLGFSDEDKVIAVFGSWGIDSLFHKVGNSLITQAKEMMKDGYRFILSIHPKEYIRYDETVEPLGEYVESLAAEGFVIRNPKESSIDYMVAADLVICDFTTLCEEAMLAKKPVILSEFSSNRVWKHSIIARYQEKGPVFSSKDDLRALVEDTISDKELENYASLLVEDLLPPEGGYKNAVCKITRDILGNHEGISLET